MSSFQRLSRDRGLITACMRHVLLTFRVMLVMSVRMTS